MKAKSTSTVLVKNYLRPYRKDAALLALVFVANIAMQTALPQILGGFIDAAKSGGLFGSALWAIVIYLAFILIQAGVSALLTYQTQSLGCRITDDHRLDVMAHYLSIGMEAHSRWRSGEMMTRLDEDVQGFFEYHYILYLKLVGSGILLVCVLAALVFRSGLLSAALLLVSVLSILGFKWIQDRGIPKYVRRAKAVAEFNGVMKETLDNAVEIRAFDAEAYVNAELKGAMRKRLRESFPASLMYGNLWSASTMVEALVLACAFLFSAYLWDGALITIGTVYLIYTYTGLVIGPLQDFRNHMGQLQGARASMLRVQELMDTPSASLGGEEVLTGGSLTLEVRHLIFAYGDGDDVLRDVSFQVALGERLGIMGETGCGKSTLISLIARLYAYTQGETLVNGANLRDIAPASLRDQVAYCTQSVQLLHGTLRENIALFDPQYADGAILDAIAKLGLMQWFAQFPQGLDTTLSLGEANLSSGEAQLIALVRMAIKNPALVLLDEMTARLDPLTEQRIVEAMKALCQGRTVIAIAHKASAITWVDRILYMENGALTVPPVGGYEA